MNKALELATEEFVRVKLQHTFGRSINNLSSEEIVEHFKPQVGEIIKVFIANLDREELAQSIQAIIDRPDNWSSTSYADIAEAIITNLTQQVER